MKQVLTEEEIRSICLDNQGDNQRIRSAEQLILAKLEEQVEPVAWMWRNAPESWNISLCDSPPEVATKAHPLYLHASRKPLEEEIERLNQECTGYTHEIAYMNVPISQHNTEIAELRQQLAEAKAENGKLREAIQYYVDREPSRPVGANVSVGREALARSKP